jgi:hypothetical protein
MNRFALSVAAAAFLLAPASPAAPIIASDSGNYNNAGDHDPGIDNYLTGVLAGVEQRSFFAFNLAGITGGSITGASLTLSNRDTSVQGVPLPGTAGAPFTLNIFDVTSLFANVVGGLTGAAVFADLGGGTLLGSLALPSNAPGDVIIPLNAAGLTYLNAGAGNNIILGLAISAPGAADQYLFFNEGNAAEFADSTRLLDVTTATPGGAVPEPTTCTLMLGALAGLVLLKRSR